MPSNPLQPAKINKEVSPFMDGRFDLISLSKDVHRTQKLADKTEHVAILPFERTSDSKISAVYGLKLDNHSSNDKAVTLILDSFDPDKDQNTFDTAYRSLLEEAGLNIDDLGLTEDDVFYLGHIVLNEPVYAKFKCYAVDFTKISRPDKTIEFVRSLSKSQFDKDSSEIIKIGFHQIVNGDYPDALILSSCFLLVSYFS